MGYQTGKKAQTFKTNFGITYCYKKYISHYCVVKKNNKKVKVNNRYNISLSEYGKIIKACNLAVMNLIIKRGIEFRLPYRMSHMSVVKKKIGFLTLPNGRVRLLSQVDWTKTHDMWNKNPEAKAKKKVVYYTNEHSAGFIIRVRYLNTYANFKGATFYRFHPTREFNKALCNEIKTNMKFDAFLAKKYADEISHYDLTKYN